jgi:hypothetical protein
MPDISSRRLGALRLVVPIFLLLLPGLAAANSCIVSQLVESAEHLPAAAPADTVRRGSLTGRLSNPAGQPLEYASVLLLRAADSSLVKATLSDGQGQFAFAQVRPGRYRLRAQQLGYRDGRSAVVQVAGGTSLALPPLVLAPAAQALGEVQVTGRKPVIERQLDRLVVNVDQLPAVAGGSATDAIGMQGKSGVLVLIDDRPVRLSPEALANMLRNMPAESIQALEVITTPPARYDAEGNAGILNIRTRQRRQPGWNADLTLRGGQGRYSRYSGGAVVGIKQQRVDLNGSYFAGRARSFEDITQYATRRVPGQWPPTELQAVSHQVRTARSHDAKAQLDVKTGPRASAGLVASLYALGNPAEGTGTARTFTAAQPSDTAVLTRSRLANNSCNYSVNGYYTVRLDSAGKSVSVDANYARFVTDQRQDFSNQTVDEARAQPVGGPEQLRSSLEGSTLIHSLKADVTLPSPRFKLETGAKYSQVAAANDFLFQREQSGTLVADARRTNQFAYQENIYAAYGSASRDWSKLSLQLGLRAEYTRTLGTSRTTQTSTRNNYFQLFPTVYAQYKFSPAYQLNLSYSRRIERPAYSSLNPFLSYQSRYFSNQGNPFLLPSFTDAVEWTNVFAHGLSVAPFFNYTRQFASEYPLQNGATRETTYTYGNLGYAYNYGVTVVAPFALGKRWKVDNDLTVYEQAFHSTYAAEPQHTRLLVYNLRVTNSFTLTPHLTAQLSGYYHSPTVQGFYRSVSYYALNAGATLKLLENKAILSLSLADLLYTERGAADVHYASQDFGFYRRNDTRLLRLAFTYKLGNTGLARKSQREAAGQEERNRAN